MSTVQYTSDDGNEHFTNLKEYRTFITSDGLTVVDDLGEEHVIASKQNPDNAYESDPFFRNHFEWVETELSTDPNWSINCPRCGHKHTDWQNYIDTDEMFGEFPVTCENEKCETTFNVKYDTHISFKTKEQHHSDFNGKPTADELTVNWTNEIGYAKATLLACGYRISHVLSMTERDAEAEIEAISE